MLAELSIVQSLCSLVAGVAVYFLTSATGWQLDLAIGLWCWGGVSGIAILWSWRSGVRARAGQVAMFETARAQGLIGS